MKTYIETIRRKHKHWFVLFQVANMLLPEDENFLLLFRRETPLNSSVEFMRVKTVQVVVILCNCPYNCGEYETM